MSPNEPYRMTELLGCLGRSKNNAHLTGTSQLYAPFSTVRWSQEEQANQTLACYRRWRTSWVMPRSKQAWRRPPSASCTPDTARPARASPPGDCPGVRAPPRRRLGSEGLWPQPIAGRCGLHGPWRRHWHPLQYSCLENPKGGGAWWAAVCGVAESDTTEAT